MVLEIDPRALHMPDKCSSIELQPSPALPIFLFCFILFSKTEFLQVTALADLELAL